MSWNAQSWGSQATAWNAPAQSSDAPKPAETGSTSETAPAGTAERSLATWNPEQEKLQLVKKLREQQKSRADCNSKWSSFCKVHGEGIIDPAKHDMAFLMTFFESYDAGTIVEFPDPTSSESTGAEVGEKIFVGGIPRTCTEDNVWAHFGQFGTVTKVEFKYDASNGFRGFGFVTFQDKASAQMVLDNKDNNYLAGKWVECKTAQTGLQPKGKEGKGGKDASPGAGKGGKGGGGTDASNDWSNNGSAGGSQGDTKIFIGGLPKMNTTEEKITTFFSQYGNVARCELKYDEQGSLRGFGFITFSDASGVQAVLSDSNVQFEGKWIDCKPAVSTGKGKADQSGGKGGGKQGGGKANSWGGGGGGGGGGDWGGGGWSDKTGNDWGGDKTGWSDKTAAGSGDDAWSKGYNKW